MEKPSFRKPRKDWKFEGSFPFTPAVVLARQLGNELIWNHHYSKPNGNYAVYKCFDQLCKAQLKLKWRKVPEVNPSNAVPDNGLPSTSITNTSDITDLYTSGSHFIHDPDDVKKMLASRSEYGIFA